MGTNPLSLSTGSFQMLFPSCWVLQEAGLKYIPQTALWFDFMGKVGRGRRREEKPAYLPGFCLREALRSGCILQGSSPPLCAIHSHLTACFASACLPGPLLTPEALQSPSSPRYTTQSLVPAGPGWLSSCSCSPLPFPAVTLLTFRIVFFISSFPIGHLLWMS